MVENNILKLINDLNKAIKDGLEEYQNKLTDIKEFKKEEISELVDDIIKNYEKTCGIYCFQIKFKNINNGALDISDYLYDEWAKGGRKHIPPIIKKKY